MKIAEINCETGEQVIRDMTVEELAQYEADQAATLSRQAEEEAKAAAKAAVLEQLGITEEQAKLLLL